MKYILTSDMFDTRSALLAHESDVFIEAYTDFTSLIETKGIYVLVRVTGLNDLADRLFKPTWFDPKNVHIHNSFFIGCKKSPVNLQFLYSCEDSGVGKAILEKIHEIIQNTEHIPYDSSFERCDEFLKQIQDFISILEI